MPQADILGITAFKTDALLRDWWEWVLVAIICGSGLVGIVAFLWFSYRSVRNALKVNKEIH
jgi:hypothetical protein